ncbi:cytochrome P450 CYP736A12 [Quercus suber]|uniref:Cytochrome p450 cyp736a12 n=1 Tax=Quercus suber TaxID=58331 RepID=A0AAW0LWA7_QUESU
MSPLTLLINLLIFLGTLGAFIQIIYASYSRPKDPKNHKKPPPGPPPLPIIGNLHKLGNHPHRYLQTLAKQYGPIMSLWLGKTPAVVVSSPEAAELFLKTHDTVFASRPPPKISDFSIYGAKKGLAFAPYGPYWRNVRKICTLQLLSASKIESFAPMRKQEVKSLMVSLKKCAAMHETVDLTKKVNEFIEGTTCRMIFGPNNGDRLKMTALIRELMFLGQPLDISSFLPFLRPLDLQGLDRRLKNVTEALDKVFDAIIREHEQVDIGQQGHHRDFVDTLLSLMNQPMNSHDEQIYTIDRESIKAIMLDMFAGASDTSSAAIEWSLSELLRHPRVMKHLQEELSSVVGMNRMVEETDLEKLPYLDMVIRESFRLHPIAEFLIPHQSMKDIEINGYYIPKRTVILINSWAIGRDPDVWSNNAEEFDPERFINNNIDIKGRDFQLLPFGSGRRGCPGMLLGITNVKYVVAQLVHFFHWELPNGMSPNDLDMEEKDGLTMPRANPLLAIPTYRLLD